jgi:hypothetical protein
VKKYQITLKCRSCTHRYKRVLFAESEEELDDVPNPPCPKCAKRSRRTDTMQQATPPIPHDGLTGIIAEQRAPGVNGSTMVKAIDQTAQIVMQDHGLSNLKDNIREGDIMAPRLPPAQQKLADNFFVNPRTGVSANGNKRQSARLARLARGAIAGQFRSTAVDVKAVLPDARVALRRVGVEEIRK